MAFDRPLEADRVDDLGLVSSFIRAPILTPLMWILGENEKKHGEENGNDTVIDTKQDSMDQTETTLVKPLSMNAPESSQITPDLSDSDVSCIADEMSSIDEDYFDESQSNRHNKSDNGFIGRAKRKNRGLNTNRIMSWSDESGQSLVEYCDELQSSGQSLQAMNSVQKSCRKPIKSAIRKSTKGSGNLSCHPSKCVPSGLAGGSISMPSKEGIMKAGNVSIGGGSGYISPQWGWYISTTPPTPEKYHANINTSIEKNDEEDHSQQLLEEAQPAVPIFKRVTNGLPKCAHGWPSVPL